MYTKSFLAISSISCTICRICSLSSVRSRGISSLMFPMSVLTLVLYLYLYFVVSFGFLVISDSASCLSAISTLNRYRQVIIIISNNFCYCHLYSIRFSIYFRSITSVINFEYPNCTIYSIIYLQISWIIILRYCLMLSSINQ